MSDQNGAPAVDPTKISPDVYLLDILLAAVRATAGQCRFRGNLALADKIDNLAVIVGPGQAMLLQQFREQLHMETYGKTASGLILPGPGNLPSPGNLPRG